MFGEAGHKLLHRARSMRRLRPEDIPSHKRGISISSDDSRASSSGSDTSRRGNSVEWDPLRLHPSMEVDRSPHITPLYHGTRHQHHHQHYEETHEGQAVENHQAAARPRHTHPGFNMKIYDGFDFGFDQPQASSRDPARRLRAPKSVGDLQQQRPKRDEEEPQWTGLHSPARRHIPGGFDEADYFIKRGGWKRRGIVFGGGNTEVTHESDEDCFDL